MAEKNHKFEVGILCDEKWRYEDVERLVVQLGHESECLVIQFKEDPLEILVLRSSVSDEVNSLGEAVYSEIIQT